MLESKLSSGQCFMNTIVLMPVFPISWHSECQSVVLLMLMKTDEITWPGSLLCQISNQWGNNLRKTKSSNSLSIYYKHLIRVMTSQLSLSVERCQRAGLQPGPSPAPHRQQGGAQLAGSQTGAVERTLQGRQWRTTITTRIALEEIVAATREVGERGDWWMKDYLIITIIRTSEINQQHLVLHWAGRQPIYKY